MSSVMPARRRAERFNAWVEGTSPDAVTDARIIGVVSVLSAAEQPTLRADFAAELRELLMAEADVALVRTERRLTLPGSLAPTQRRSHRRLAVAASAFAVVGATTSVSLAAQHALPGDALYPIKRAIESAQTDLASGDAKTVEMLSNAASRLSEATALATRGTPESDAAVPQTVNDFSAQATEAADQALASGDRRQITQLRQFTATSMRELELLDSVAQASAHAAVAAAATVLTDIDRRALAQCPTCGGAVVDLPKIFLASGPGSGGKRAGTVVAGVTAPSVRAPQVLAPLTGPGQPAAGTTDGQAGPTAPAKPNLVSSGGTGGSTDPLSSALNTLVNGGQSTGTSTTSPVAPITTPIKSAIDNTLQNVTSPSP